MDNKAIALREPLQRWLAGQSCHISLKPPDIPLDWLAEEARFQQWLAEITADTAQEPV